MCFFCDKPGGETCDSPACQRHDREYQEHLRQLYRSQLIAGVKSAIRERCKGDTNWSLSRAWRWWLTVKLLICVALRLSYRGKETWPECVEVGCFHERHDGYGWDADWIRVGYGVWNGWWFDLHHDGDSFY